MNEHMNEKISRRNEICSDLSWPYVKDVNPTPEQRAERVLNNLFGLREDHKANKFFNPAIACEIRDAVNQALKVEKPRHAVGVSVLLVENKMVLLGRRKNNVAAGWLGTPGGRLEHT